MESHPAGGCGNESQVEETWHFLHEYSRIYESHLSNHVTRHGSWGALKRCDILGGRGATSPSVLIIQEFSVHPGHIIVVDVYVQEGAQCSLDLVKMNNTRKYTS